MHPHRVVLLVFFLNEVLLVRLVVNKGVRVTEFVTGMGRSIIHAEVYGDVLVVATTIYPTLMVVQLSV